MKLEKLTLFFGVLTYILALYIGYTQLISPHYTYYSFVNLHPSFGVKFFSTTLALLPLAWIQSKVSRPSQVVYWLLYLLVYVPTMILPDFIRKNPFDSFLMYKGCLVICLFLLYNVSKWKRIPIYYLRFHQKIVSIFLYGTWAGLFSLIFLRYGFHFRFVNFSDIYDIRANYHEEGRGTLASYAINWQSKILNPLFLGVGVVRKNIVLVMLGAVSQFIIFSTTGQKSLFFSSLFICGLLFCIRKQAKSFGIRFVCGVSFVVNTCLVIDFITGGIRFTEILTRRLMMIPGLLSSFYYDFFTLNPKTHLGYSIFSPFVDYPYDVNPPFLIGEAYFNNLETSANANLWADAFSAFGLTGVLVYTLILALILWLYDSISSSHDIFLPVVLIAMPTWSLIDSSLITAFLTHGLFLAFIVNYLLLNKKSQEILCNKPSWKY